MSTMSKTRRSVKFSCEFVSITIRISDTKYGVDPIDPGEFGTKAWRLSKAGGDHEVYDVIRTHQGVIECSCPSYIATHSGTASTCKHGRALTTLGLLEAPIVAFRELTPATATPAPIVEPAPVACCDPTEPAPCTECVPSPVAVPVDPPSSWEGLFPDVEEGHPSTWDPAWDEFRWNLGPEPVADPEPIAEPVGDWSAPFATAEPTAEDLADFGEWKNETAAREHLDASERLTLAELVERQVAFYESWGNSSGQMFADAMTKLLMQVRLTSANSPAELDARVDAMEADARAAWEASGYEQGCLAGHFDAYA